MLHGKVSWLIFYASGFIRRLFILVPTSLSMPVLSESRKEFISSFIKIIAFDTDFVNGCINTIDP